MSYDDDEDEDMEEDFEDDDDSDEDDEDNDDYRKCGTCKHWASGSGRCFCKGTPHYYNNDSMNADDGCDYWES